MKKHPAIGRAFFKSIFLGFIGPDFMLSGTTECTVSLFSVPLGGGTSIFVAFIVFDSESGTKHSNFKGEGCQAVWVGIRGWLIFLY